MIEVLPFLAERAIAGGISLAASRYVADRALPHFLASASAASKGRGIRELLHLHETVPLTLARLHTPITDPVRSGIHPFRVILGYRDGRPVQTRRNGSVVVWGPPGSGKTVLMVCNVLAWLMAGGVVICGSEADDVLAATRTASLHCGKVYAYDPSGAINAQHWKGVIPLPWSPMRGCEDESTALDRAGALMARCGSGTEGGDYFRQSNTQLLGCLMHAAALEGMPWSTVYGWAMHFASVIDREHPENSSYGGSATAFQILSRHKPPGDAMLEALAGFMRTEPKTLDPILSTLRGALAWSAKPDLRTSADAADTAVDFRRILSTPGTSIHFVCPAGKGMSDIGALVAGFLGEIARALRSLANESPTGRVPHPVGRFLDEAPNYPVELPEYLALDRKRDITTVCIGQTLGQFERTWGRQFASDVRTTCRAKVILPGTAEPELTGWASEMSGHRHTPITATNVTWSRHVKAQGKATDTKTQDGENGEEAKASAGVKYGRRWHKTGRTETTTPTREPRMTPSDICHIETGSAWVLDGNKPAGIVTLPRYWEVRPYSIWTAMGEPAQTMETAEEEAHRPRQIHVPPVIEELIARGFEDPDVPLDKVLALPLPLPLPKIDEPAEAAGGQG